MRRRESEGHGRRFRRGTTIAGSLILSLAVWVVVPPVLYAQVDAGDEVAGRFRHLEGRHLTLITDVSAQAAVDELPGVFDQAVEQWCDYFQVPASDVADWHLRAFLMENRSRFRHAGYLPDTLPPFPHGYQRGDDLWIVEQPSDYYRRHLLLHEGTHAFMWRWLGGTGPAWYAEGMAELLATHQYQDGRLRLKIIPRDKEATPDWGRIKLIRQAVDAGQGRTLDEAWNFTPRRSGDVEAYAWSWAIVTLLDGHPQWHDRLHALTRRLRDNNARFQRALQRDLAPDRPALDEAWQVFLDQLDYGYQVDQERVGESPQRSWDHEAELWVDSQRGWQSTGLMLRAGERYAITAAGRYRLNEEEPPWISEAGGVTLRYHRGWPLGILLAAVRPEEGPQRAEALTRPQPVGWQSRLEPTEDGVLFLRVNEGAGQLADNEGKLRVRIQRQATARPSQPD